MVDFKFKQYENSEHDYAGFPGLKKHYEEIFINYFKSINYTFEDNYKFEIKFYRLDKINTKNGPSYLELNSENEEGYVYSGLNNILSNQAFNIIGVFTNNSIVKETVFKFYIYGQNNCCGILSISDTYVNINFQGNKIGEILQYLKEDIAYLQDVSLLTCTDIILNGSKTYNNIPYKVNHKLLLKTGWKLVSHFYNIKSYNIVGLFSKHLLYTDKKEITLKLKDYKAASLLDKIEDITIGCDPELFLKVKNSDEFVPSFMVMEGDKRNPVKITEEGHNIQCDNVMVEYGIPPCRTEDEFVSNNNIALNYIKTKIADPNDLEMVIFPTAKFTDGNLMDKRAKVFGCDPDFNAYLEGMPNTVGRKDDNLRCAGGHIHIGYKDNNRITNMTIVRLLDIYLSIPLLIMEPNNERKTMYGKAGAFRHQPWGVEYRVTSNYIFSSSELMRWTYNQVMYVLENFKTCKKYLGYYNVQHIINTNDTMIAKEVINKFDLKLLESKELKKV